MSGDFRALEGGYKAVYHGALPALGSSTALFNTAVTTALTNNPGKTICKVVFTLRTAGITMTFDGTTAATAGSVGIDYPTGTYELWLNANELKNCRAIQNGGAATGYVVVFAAA